MMNQLCIDDGSIIVVQNVSLPQAHFSKFQPQTVDFLDITNPKAVYPNASVTSDTHAHAFTSKLNSQTQIRK